jgi:hypothetical protein
MYRYTIKHKRSKSLIKLLPPNWCACTDLGLNVREAKEKSRKRAVCSLVLDLVN